MLHEMRKILLLFVYKMYSFKDQREEPDAAQLTALSTTQSGGQRLPGDERGRKSPGLVGDRRRAGSIMGGKQTLE